MDDGMSSWMASISSSTFDQGRYQLPFDSRISGNNNNNSPVPIMTSIDRSVMTTHYSSVGPIK